MIDKQIVLQKIKEQYVVDAHDLRTQLGLAYNDFWKIIDDLEDGELIESESIGDEYDAAIYIYFAQSE